MKKIIITFLLLSSCAILFGQRNRHNIVFDHGQKTLDAQHKAQIRSLTNKVRKGEHISFYPLAYDSLNKRYVYTSIAGTQLNAIVKYAESVGFKFSNMPKNFPSAYKGSSIAVNMRYVLNKDSLSPGQQKQLLHNPLKDRFPQKKSQFFTINPLKDTTITGAEGTKIDILAGALLCKVPVKVELIEYYSNADFIKNGLTTSSNGRLIETGGTLFLDAKEASNPSKQVNINPLKGLDITFASDTQKGMQLFVKDPNRPTELNWVLSEQRSSSTKRFQFYRMTEKTFGPDGKLIAEKNFNSKEEWEKYQLDQKAAAEKKKLAIEKKKIEKMGHQNMRNKLRTYNLGFINCDRFNQETSIPYFVNEVSSKKAEYYLVFKDIKGVLQGSVYNQKVGFGKIPLNKAATLIVVSFDGEQAYFYKSNTVINTNTKVDIDLKPVTKDFIDQQLVGLN